MQLPRRIISQRQDLSHTVSFYVITKMIRTAADPGTSLRTFQGASLLANKITNQLYSDLQALEELDS